MRACLLPADLVSLWGNNLRACYGARYLWNHWAFGPESSYLVRSCWHCAALRYRPFHYRQDWQDSGQTTMTDRTNNFPSLTQGIG